MDPVGPVEQMQKRQKLATGMAAEGVLSCCLAGDELVRLQVGARCHSCLEPPPLHVIKPTKSTLRLRGLPATASFRRPLPVAYHRALLPGAWYTVSGELDFRSLAGVLQCLT